MLKTSRKETAGIVAVVVVFGLTLTGLIVKSMRAATEPGITLREAFAQPPGGPPPGRPAGDVSPAPASSPSGANLPDSNGSPAATASPLAATPGASSATASASGASRCQTEPANLRLWLLLPFRP